MTAKKNKEIFASLNICVYNDVFTGDIQMSKDAKKKPILNNLVAKHMEEFNRPATHVNRKKNMKNGYAKHKRSNNDY